VEAVHFAIALSYYGLLHISSSETASRSELCKMETRYVKGVSNHVLYIVIMDNDNDQVLLNFGRLIHQYVHVFLYDRPRETLQYIYLLSLYSARNGYTSDDMLDLCRSCMTNLVLRSNDFKSTLVYLIGDSNAAVSTIDIYLYQMSSPSVY
jgi:nuclear pore complex protein Nup93